MAPTRHSDPARRGRPRAARPGRAASIVALVGLARIVGCTGFGLVAGCGWLPPDSPAQPAAPPDPDAPALHDWRVTGHVLGTRALISDLDAVGFDARHVTVSATGYTSPWSGTCEQANRQRTPRPLAELATEHDIPAAAVGLADPITEYRLSCVAGSAPGLTLYVAGPRAVTCFAGVCYQLAR